MPEAARSRGGFPYDSVRRGTKDPKGLKSPKGLGAGCPRDADALVVEKVRFVLLIDEQGRPDSDDDWTWDSLKRSRRLPGLRIFSGAPRPLVLCLSTAGRAAPSWSRISKKWKGQREKSAADFSLLHQSRAGDRKAPSCRLAKKCMGAHYTKKAAFKPINATHGLPQPSTSAAAPLFRDFANAG